MDAHPILKGIGIAVAIIILVRIRLGLFRYIFEKITDRMARPGRLNLRSFWLRSFKVGWGSLGTALFQNSKASTVSIPANRIMSSLEKLRQPPRRVQGKDAYSTVSFYLPPVVVQEQIRPTTALAVFGP